MGFIARLAYVFIQRLINGDINPAEGRTFVRTDLPIRGRLPSSSSFPRRFYESGEGDTSGQREPGRGHDRVWLRSCRSKDSGAIAWALHALSLRAPRYGVFSCRSGPVRTSAARNVARAIRRYRRPRGDAILGYRLDAAAPTWPTYILEIARIDIQNDRCRSCERQLQAGAIACNNLSAAKEKAPRPGLHSSTFSNFMDVSSWKFSVRSQKVRLILTSIFVHRKLKQILA